MTGTFSLSDVNQMSLDVFGDVFGAIYEHSPWIAEKAAQARPFQTFEEMCRAFSEAVQRADRIQQYDLIRSHPELGIKKGETPALAESSRQEQKSAGLDQLAEDDYNSLRSLNDKYQQKFSMPFIICVRKIRGNVLDSVTDSIRRRLRHDQETERAEALHQIDEIAALRLREKIRP